MSTVEDIEQAIERLPKTEREMLEAHLLARRFGLGSLGEEERAALLKSVEEADREIDQGRSHAADELRQAVRSWTGA